MVDRAPIEAEIGYKATVGSRRVDDKVEFKERAVRYVRKPYLSSSPEVNSTPFYLVSKNLTF